MRIVGLGEGRGSNESGKSHDSDELVHDTSLYEHAAHLQLSSGCRESM